MHFLITLLILRSINRIKFSFLLIHVMVSIRLLWKICENERVLEKIFARASQLRVYGFTVHCEF